MLHTSRRILNEICHHSPHVPKNLLDNKIIFLYSSIAFFHLFVLLFGMATVVGGFMVKSRELLCISQCNS